ncbi:MAG: hypothetical protein LBF24_02930 [Puniceicoccales bacterium]|nr:hypothetical protein [Puniceicoccales bacterium]
MEEKQCCGKGCCCRSGVCWLKLGIIVIVAFAAGFAVHGCCRCRCDRCHASATERSHAHKKAVTARPSAEKPAK